MCRRLDAAAAMEDGQKSKVIASETAEFRFPRQGSGILEQRQRVMRREIISWEVPRLQTPGFPDGETDW